MFDKKHKFEACEYQSKIDWIWKVVDNLWDDKNKNIGWSHDHHYKCISER